MATSPSHPQPDTSSPNSPTTSTSSSSSLDPPPPQPAVSRPTLPRQTSATLIIAHDAPNVELQSGDEEFGADDARAMSPRRTSADLEKMSQEARAQLSQHAKRLHESLLEIFNRIEAVREEHDKLDSNNKFLQKYIGDLMSTSKITATGSGGRKK